MCNNYMAPRAQGEIIMGWRFDKQGDKYRVWSTVVDEYLTDWLDRSDVLAYIYQDRLESFKKGIIELYMSFPDKRGTIEGNKIHMDRNLRVCYSIWTIELFNLEDEEYDQELERKFNEALEFMGVKEK